MSTTTSPDGHKNRWQGFIDWILPMETRASSSADPRIKYPSRRSIVPLCTLTIKFSGKFIKFYFSSFILNFSSSFVFMRSREWNEIGARNLNNKERLFKYEQNFVSIFLIFLLPIKVKTKKSITCCHVM